MADVDMQSLRVRYRAAVGLLERGDITGPDALYLIVWPPPGRLEHVATREVTHPEATRVEARQLLADGLTYRQVSQRLGVPSSTVKSWVSRAGRRQSERHNATS